MLTQQLIRLIFEAAHIQRWNEFIRPEAGMTELDKQAHKAIIAYVLAKSAEESGAVDYTVLINGFIAQFLHRTLITDIKPQVYRRLYAAHAARIDAWTHAQLAGRLGEGALLELVREADAMNPASIEARILRAAHYLASRWEFGIIEPLNQSVYGIRETKKAIEAELEEHYGLTGVQKIALGQKSHDFIDLLGRLRFQKRWTKTPRVPATSVMGHMITVALLAYVASLEVGACPARAKNAFFAGLFHDIPEVLTRDIISPVKHSIEGLDALVAEIEADMLDNELLPLVGASWRQEFAAYIKDEFACKITSGEGRISIAPDEFHARCNSDAFDPIDGRIVEACDKFAAYVEASLSLEHGIVSKHLVDAKRHLLEKYRTQTVHGLDFGALYLAFALEP